MSYFWRDLVCILFDHVAEFVVAASFAKPDGPHYHIEGWCSRCGNKIYREAGWRRWKVEK